jgi:hypothetical protein
MKSMNHPESSTRGVWLTPAVLVGTEWLVSYPPRNVVHFPLHFLNFSCSFFITLANLPSHLDTLYHGFLHLSFSHNSIRSCLMTILESPKGVSLSQLISYIGSQASDGYPSLLQAPKFRVQLSDGSEDRMELPLNVICALVILKGPNLTDLTSFFSQPIPLSEVNLSMTLIRQFVSANDLRCPSLQEPIDADRLMRDAKYAQNVTDLILLNATNSDYIHYLVNVDLKGRVFELSVNSLGCRIIQQLLEIASPSDRMTLVHPEMTYRVVELTTDVNGNHVMQKTVDVLTSMDCGFVIEQLMTDIRRVSSHCYGCRVVQRVISKCDNIHKDCLLETLSTDTGLMATLIEDVFGNYVAQHLIEYGREIDRERVAICLSGLDLCELSCSKYASNVIEKIIRSFDSPVTGHNGIVLIKILINSILLNPSGILDMMKDRYGNYVVRGIIELSYPDFQEEVDSVRSIVSASSVALKKFTYGWHLVERMEKSRAISNVSTSTNSLLFLPH